MRRAWDSNGKIDALITLSNKPWDMAAGVIITREAGAYVVDRDGSPHTLQSKATVAATPELVGVMMQLLLEAEASVGDDSLEV